MNQEPELSMADVMLPNLEQMVKDEMDKFFKAAIKFAEDEKATRGLTCTFTEMLE